MHLPDFMTLPFWNGLARDHLADIVTVLTAAVVVLLDRYLRKMVHKFASPHGKVFRFVVFLIVVSFGYATISLGAAYMLRSGLTWKGGAYMAPLAIGALLLIAFEAQRQKQA